MFWAVEAATSHLCAMYAMVANGGVLLDVHEHRERSEHIRILLKIMEKWCVISWGLAVAGGDAKGWIQR